MNRYKIFLKSRSIVKVSLILSLGALIGCVDLSGPKGKGTSSSESVEKVRVSIPQVINFISKVEVDLRSLADDYPDADRFVVTGYKSSVSILASEVRDHPVVKVNGQVGTKIFLSAFKGERVLGKQLKR